jgi:hypothetical protein
VYRETLIPFWQQNWFIALLFVMALAFFGLSIFLFLNLDLDGASFSPASAASDSGPEVRLVILLLFNFEQISNESLIEKIDELRERLI